MVLPSAVPVVQARGVQSTWAVRPAGKSVGRSPRKWGSCQRNAVYGSGHFKSGNAANCLISKVYEAKIGAYFHRHF